MLTGRTRILQLAVICSLVQIGLGSASVQAECCPGPVSNRVYVIRGAAGWWPAYPTMHARLQRHGYDPDVYIFSGVNHAVDNLVERRRCGEEVGPVRIIGYSLGGHGAVNMAWQLKERGIPIDKLLLVECFSNTTVPSNVRYCFSLYETRHTDELIIFRGTPVKRESCYTHLVNIDVAVHPNWQEQRRRNHFTMADDTRVQQTLVHLLSCNCIWHGPSRNVTYADVDPPLPSDFEVPPSIENASQVPLIEKPWIPAAPAP